MSVEVDYYVNTSLSIGELAAKANRELGCALAPYQGSPANYFAWFMGMEFSLFPNKSLLEDDDGELNYSGFNYSFSFHTNATNRMRAIQLPVILSVVQILQWKLDLGGMLVYDAQMLLARYVRKDPPEPARGLSVPFRDVISGTDLDDFEHHLSAVTRRFGAHNPFVVREQGARS